MKLLILCNLGLSVATGLELPVAAVGIAANIPGMIGTSMMGAGKGVVDKALQTKKKLYESCRIRDCEDPWICYQGKCQECRQDDRVLGLVCEPSLQCMKIANAPLNLYLGCYNAAKYVDCGGHVAETCQGCAAGNGGAFCNGDCQWIGQECFAKATTAAPLELNGEPPVKCDHYNESPALCAAETKDCYWWTSDVLAIKPKCKDLKAWRNSLEIRSRKELNRITGNKMDPDGAIENAEKAICGKHSSFLNRETKQNKCAEERGAACVWDTRWGPGKCIPRGSTVEPVCTNKQAAPFGGCRCVAKEKRGDKKAMENVCEEGSICNQDSKDLCIVDKCLANHCKNSSFCNQLTGKCTCTGSWEGEFCEQEPLCDEKQDALYPGCRCVVKKTRGWNPFSKETTMEEVCAESFICEKGSKDQASLCHEGVAIDGKVSEGEMLTANTSAIATSKEDKPFGFKWYRGDLVIPNSETGTYVLQGSDIGEEIRVKVTYDSAGVNTEKTSAATAKVASNYSARDAKIGPHQHSAKLNRWGRLNGQVLQQVQQAKVDRRNHVDQAARRDSFDEMSKMAISNNGNSPPATPVQGNSPPTIPVQGNSPPTIPVQGNSPPTIPVQVAPVAPVAPASVQQILPSGQALGPSRIAQQQHKQQQQQQLQQEQLEQQEQQEQQQAALGPDVSGDLSLKENGSLNASI